MYVCRFGSPYRSKAVEELAEDDGDDEGDEDEQRSAQWLALEQKRSRQFGVNPRLYWRFRCITCDVDNICHACAKLCHRGHKLYRKTEPMPVTEVSKKDRVNNATPTDLSALSTHRVLEEIRKGNQQEVEKIAAQKIAAKEMVKQNLSPRKFKRKINALGDMANPEDLIKDLKDQNEKKILKLDLNTKAHEELLDMRSKKMTARAALAKQEIKGVIRAAEYAEFNALLDVYHGPDSMNRKKYIRMKAEQAAAEAARKAQEEADRIAEVWEVMP
jgi:hypothetical protein